MVLEAARCIELRKQELNDLKQQLQEEIQTNQERQSSLQDIPDLKELMKQIQKENELKQQAVNIIHKMVPPEGERFCPCTRYPFWTARRNAP